MVRPIGGGLALGAAVLGVVAAPTDATTRAAADLAGYEAVAASDGLRIQVETPGLLLSNLFDGGAPVVQASLDAVGSSQAFAAMPYPGETALTAPNLLLPLLGLPGLPVDYPLVASSNHPVEPDSVSEAGAFRFAAQSRPHESTASVTAGTDLDGYKSARLVTRATATVDPQRAIVGAASETTVEALTIASVLRIARVHSGAVVQRSATGQEVEGTFEVEGLSVAGIGLVLTRDGLALGGTSVLPAVDLAAVEAVLAERGIGIEYLEETPIEGGVISAGMAISIPSPLDAPYHGTVTITLGRARAAVSAAYSSTPTGGAPAPADSASTRTPTAPAIGATSGTVASGTEQGASPQPVPAPIVEETVVSVVTPIAFEISTLSFYLALVLAALVAVVGAALVHSFGIGGPWTR